MLTEKDGLGDWRLHAASRLSKDVPAAYAGGPAHRAGAALREVMITVSEKGPIGFVMPSPAAMSISIAIAGAADAMRRRMNIGFTGEIVTPLGRGKNVRDSSVADLFGYFESCMVAATFSFQAVEAFSNAIVRRKLGREKTITIGRRGGNEKLNADEVERQISTEEKIATVLPILCEVDSPKGGRIWEKFVDLKHLRDSTIHLKTSDQYGEVDKDSLFFQFLNREAVGFPALSIDVMLYFTSGNPRRWLRGAIEKLAELHSASNPGVT
jgi:hypothetical protein